jgi:hypothetical protein
MFTRRESGQPSKRDLFIAEAASQVGYTARPNRNSFYGERTGYNSHPWSGSFIDVVAHSTDVDIPSLVYPTAALQVFMKTGRLHVTPKPGDIAFFAFPTEGHFDVQHVGIVEDVTGVTFNGSFRTIEAQVTSGNPKAQDQRDSVHTRVRFLTDVVAFGRPNFKRSRLKVNDGGLDPKDSKVPLINIARVLTFKPSIDVELIQLALAVTVDLRNAKRGHWDAQTRSAFANFQRNVGYVGDDATGTPDPKSLQLLAAASGKIFQVP